VIELSFGGNRRMSGSRRSGKMAEVSHADALHGRAYNSQMSHKRYQFKLIEAADAPDLEIRLREAGSQQWSAVGYGVLPDGRRSVLMERKVKAHTHRHRDDGRREEAVAADE
jgi:hypothetical protein